MRRLTENIKSLVLIILGISIPVLWTAYIYMQFDPTEAKSPQLENSFWIFTDDAQHSETVTDDAFFKPLSVSLILAGTGYTSAYNPELTDVLYDNCNPLINEVFSSSYVCKTADRSDWENALSNKDFILIEYPEQLPYTYIAEFSHTNKGFCDGEMCYTKKLMLFNDDKSILTALSADSNGNVYSFTRNTSESPALRYDFNSNNLAAYTVNKGFIEFVFNNGSFDSLPSDYKLLLSPPSLPSIMVETPLQYVIDGIFSENAISYLELIEHKTMSQIFNIFEINPHIAGYYSDPNSGLYLVGENTRLTLYPNGKMSYSVTDKNNPTISIATLLNTTRTDFTSVEKLTAATVFVSKLSADMLGGDATPVLDRVSYSPENGEITFTFGYYYLMTEVLYNGKNNAISLTFNDYGLLSADFLPLHVSPAEDVTIAEENILTTDTLPDFAAQLLDGQSELQPIYEFDSFKNTVTPYWAAGGR